MGYFKTTHHGFETPEAGDSPLLTGDLKTLAAQIDTVLGPEAGLLSVATRATSGNLLPGELVKLGASITLTLDGAGVVGVLPSGLYTAKISAGVGHTISGGGLPSPVEQITVLPGQSVLIRVFENNGYIIDGETAESRAIRATTTGGTAPSLLSWGSISAAGAIEASSGDFTVEKLAEGRYRVNFKTAKASAKYAIQLTSTKVSGSATYCWWEAKEATGFNANTDTQAEDGELIVVGFDFVVMAAS